MERVRKVIRYIPEYYVEHPAADKHAKHKVEDPIIHLIIRDVKMLPVDVPTDEKESQYETYNIGQTIPTDLKRADSDKRRVESVDEWHTGTRGIRVFNGFGAQDGDNYLNAQKSGKCMVKKKRGKSAGATAASAKKKESTDKVKIVVPATRLDEKKALEQVHHEAKELFNVGNEWNFRFWLRKYSPVIVPLLVGLITYFYLVFYLFYPQLLMEGHVYRFMFFILFTFLLGGVFIYLGLRSELLFMRILSFIFVFVIFSFLLMFVLLSHILRNGLVT